jgi:hypothetical protein
LKVRSNVNRGAMCNKDHNGKVSGVSDFVLFSDFLTDSAGAGEKGETS